MKETHDTDAYIDKNPEWSPIFRRVVKVFRKFELEEKLKWGIPVFCLDNKNLVGIAGFKNHCALWFYNGSGLTDPAKVLVSAQEDKQYALKQWRFTKEEDVDEKVLEEYIKESIELQKRGMTLPRVTKSVQIPDELKLQLELNPELQKALDSLTPGLQKEYFQYIHDAKQTQTKEKRVQKIVPLILNGQGLNDKYKK